MVRNDSVNLEIHKSLDLIGFINCPRNELHASCASLCEELCSDILVRRAEPLRSKVKKSHELVEIDIVAPDKV